MGETIELEDSESQERKSKSKSKSKSKNKGSGKELQPIPKMLSASGGAALTVIFTTPFDVLKTRAQIENRKIRVSELVRSEGTRSLFRGLQTGLVMSVPVTGIYFVMYESFKEFLIQVCSLGFAAPLVSGSAARIVTSTLVCPLEIARTNFQASSSSNAQVGKSSAFGLLRTVVRDRGFRGLWTGLGPTLFRDAPFSAIYWAGYELIKEQMIGALGFSEKSLVVAFTAGAVSGLAGAAATTPLDVIKSRRQAQLMVSAERAGSLEIAKSIWNTTGYKGFLAGVGPRCAKVAPACAIMISTYEGLRSVLET
ncbi:mitochondrial solute carrier family 25 member 39/40 [Andalucia godoyi]|uniref:Mitochondrial solute carrier family 25 member 39/40 n=1 Tax=Andalucia godoyi TaxID=505711 RepID=A0A8K0AHM1_ANDGO|nr:mitochondrial solute carrier family 25 member 39/40 [Andalucia godoyi]|eukprot:ANDGO_05368.mRNA.1 mitochondrial solute carrier family 25 member 39/40